MGLGALQAGVFWLLGEEILHKERRDFVVGKIAEFAKFAGGERRKSPDLISLYERSESLGRGPTESLRAVGADAYKDINLSVNVRWGLDGRLLWLSEKDIEDECRFLLMCGLGPDIAGRRSVSARVGLLRVVCGICGRESGVQRFSQNR